MSVDDARLEQQEMDKKRLRTTFHRTFALSRDQIRQLLDAAARVEEVNPVNRNCLTAEAIRSQTQLGTVQVEAMPRYSRACGLLDERLCLTPFGQTVFDRDPLLETPTTQWLMHYHISAAHGVGPPFWSQTVTSLFKAGDEISHSQVAAYISKVVAETEGRELTERDARSTATVFLGTYTSAEALAQLGILEELTDNRYLVQEPDPPSPWVFGLALLDYWRAAYGENRLTINLDDLSAPGALGDIFLIGPGRINRTLARLQDEGFVEVYRLAPPYQVVLRQTDPAPLLEKLYALDADADD